MVSEKRIYSLWPWGTAEGVIMSNRWMESGELSPGRWEMATSGGERENRRTRTPRRSPAPSALPRTSGSSPSPLLFGSPSPPQAPPPPAPPPLVGPLESAAIPPPWLLPPSAPPWATVMAVAWVPPGSSYSGSLLSLPWLLPPSSPPWPLSAGPLLGARPPPEPPP